LILSDEERDKRKVLLLFLIQESWIHDQRCKELVVVRCAYSDSIKIDASCVCHSERLDLKYTGKLRGK
jgi:hypothetical protein